MIIIGVHITKHLSPEIVPSHKCGGMALGTPPEKFHGGITGGARPLSRPKSQDLEMGPERGANHPLPVEKGMDGGQFRVVAAAAAKTRIKPTLSLGEEFTVVIIEVHIMKLYREIWPNLLNSPLQKVFSTWTDQKIV